MAEPVEQEDPIIHQIMHHQEVQSHQMDIINNMLQSTPQIR